jgi:hypothetical protein
VQQTIQNAELSATQHRLGAGKKTYASSISSYETTSWGREEHRKQTTQFGRPRTAHGQPQVLKDIATHQDPASGRQSVIQQQQWQIRD